MSISSNVRRRTKEHQLRWCRCTSVKFSFDIGRGRHATHRPARCCALCSSKLGVPGRTIGLILNEGQRQEGFK